MSTIAKILLIEDDAAIATVVHDLLSDAGYSCEVESDGMQGLQRALTADFDLLLLDVALPSISGLDICKRVKATFPLLPIIMFTARSEEADVVSGLEVGADDYIQKPFRPRELLARVRTRLREQTQRKLDRAVSKEVQGGDGSAPAPLLRIGALMIDAERMRVTKNGEEVQLSAREYQVLTLLAMNPGRPLSREEILEHAWNFSAERYSVNVSIFMYRLRRKIEDDPDTPRYLLTVRGVGYRFAEPHEL